MGFIRALIAFSGRALLVAIFLASALMKLIPKFDDTMTYIAAEGVPEPRWALIGAIACMLIGGVSVLLGFWARLGALLLAVFLAATNYYIHDFWHFEGADQEMQMIHFMKNAALLGAMVFIIGNGPGPGSVDKRKVTISV